MKNAQEWINRNYLIRKTTTETLDIKSKGLKDSLKLGEFGNLKKLDCQDNSLTELDIRGCSNLIKLYCFNNPLKKLYLDGIEDTDWKKVQEQLKDCLKENKKGEQYYDLQLWKKFQDTSTTSPTPSVRTSISSSSKSSTSFLLKSLPFFSQTNKSEREQTTNEVVKVNQEVQVHELQFQLMKLNDIVCPESDFDFARLENEIRKLKGKEVELKWQNKKNELNHQENNFAEEEQEWFETYCEAQEELQQNNSDFIRKQLEKSEKKLLEKITKEELLSLAQLKKEVLYLKKQLVTLGWQEQQSQIEVLPKK